MDHDIRPNLYNRARRTATAVAKSIPEPEPVDDAVSEVVEAVESGGFDIGSHKVLIICVVIVIIVLLVAVVYLVARAWDPELGKKRVSIDPTPKVMGGGKPKSATGGKSPQVEDNSSDDEDYLNPEPAPVKKLKKSTRVKTSKEEPAQRLEGDYDHLVDEIMSGIKDTDSDAVSESGSESSETSSPSSVSEPVAHDPMFAVTKKVVLQGGEDGLKLSNKMPLSRLVDIRREGESETFNQWFDNNGRIAKSLKVHKITV